MNRVIFVDFSVFMFRAIFGTYSNPTNKIPTTYCAMSMILKCFKILGVTQDDLVVMAIDSPKGSWRKDYDKEYKGNRKQKRDSYAIDWKKEFDDFKRLKENLKYNTPFLVLEGDKLEADDIISYGVRLYKNYPCIVISTDSDYEQLAKFENVKLFSNASKKFKEVKNPYKILAKKIEEERSDNLLSPVLTEEDYRLRKMLVDLTSLPDFVEDQLKGVFDAGGKYKRNVFNYTGLQHKSLHKRYIELFDKPKVKKSQMELV